MGNSTLFVSQQLEYSDHNLSIIVGETGQNGRNYTLDFFEVIRPKKTTSLNDKSTTKGSKSDVAAIVGGVVGTLMFLIIALLFFLWMRRKRLLSDERSRSLGIPCFGRTKTNNDECTSLSRRSMTSKTGDHNLLLFQMLIRIRLRPDVEAQSMQCLVMLPW